VIAAPVTCVRRDDGEVPECEGRVGHGYSVTDRGSRKTVIVDPVTLTMLEKRDVLDPRSLGVPTRPHAGDVVGSAIHLQRAVVAQAGA
jgi:hypothetical protein